MDQLTLLDAVSQYLAVTCVIGAIPPIAIWLGMLLMRQLGWFGWISIPFKREDIEL